MSALLAILLAGSAPAVEGGDIVVIAQRFAGISASVTRDAAGKYGCALSDTSGSAKLDSRLCKAATQCVRKGAAASDEVKACIEAAKPKLLADFRRTYQAQP
ncbi:MAG: hypothetical protein J7496_07560 [Novosphingobium sp.]|nr:hypothetical protein [Novosphingobium sp.]MBO9602348.1 hypothetical protein [Novosphingobium sp.]